MTDWTKPEPPPAQTGSTAVWPMVIADIEASARGPFPPLFLSPRNTQDLADSCRQRHEMGVAKYGHALEVNNGRSPLNDLRDEALDAVAYSRQQYERTKASADWELHLIAVQFAARVVQRIMETKR